MKIAIIGARGIPAKYGGAETFISELAPGLAQRGYEVYVTCNSRKFGMDKYEGVTRIHTPAIEGKTFTVPALNEILATIHLQIRCPKIDLVYYVLDYGAVAAILPRLLGKTVVINADGIEWKRPLIRKQYLAPGWKPLAVALSWYMKLMEWMSVKLSHAVIADSRAIEDYLDKRYHAQNVVFIAYGSERSPNLDITAMEENQVLQQYGLTAGEYYLTMCRVVAENNIHRQIEGFKRSKSAKSMVIAGNFQEKDRYAMRLRQLARGYPKIILISSIWDKKPWHILRKNCYAYIHSYRLGGTNPSLVEQMAFGRPIIAYDVPFHREILEDGGLYFQDEDSLASIIETLESDQVDLKNIANRYAKRIAEEYNWDFITEKYNILFSQLLLKQ
ncbi:MAG: DUF1972 domain-containing protein [Dehalococcoidia bacterium]